jgi:hypothetical protein
LIRLVLTARLRRSVPIAGLLASLIAGTAACPVRAASPVIEAAAAAFPGQAQTWTMNLYRDGAVRWQNPDWRACTAASTMSMLNLIAYSSPEVLPVRAGDTTTTSLVWQVDTSFGRQEDILTFERDHMTTGRWIDGTDPHGWRNALNWYGWGSLDAGVYKDAAYSSFESAAWATVIALARTQKPVGILAWYGSHAQYVTGYKVTGGDPRVSDNFRIDAIYLTDPWRPDAVRNKLVSYSTWKRGPDYIRFGPYWQTDYTTRDPIDGQIGYKEWRGRYVVELPVR